MDLTEQQIEELAPDASSLKSGKELASPQKWQLMEYSDHALWGECKGSGKLPYQTQIDLQSIAFKCSCPSRKFPCKHGLSLLLLYARDPTKFTKKDDEPEWVSSWLNKRKEKTEKKNEPSKPVDAQAQAKRADARMKKVKEGITELQQWVRDLIRFGLLGLPEKPNNFWENPAKRMVDAQAPGLAALIREMSNLGFYQEGWQYKALKALLKIHLICESFHQLDQLEKDLQDELKSLIGFPVSKEEVYAKEGIRDQWMVLSKSYEELDNITMEKNWLYGVQSNRFALFIQFIAFRQVPEFNLLRGASIEGELFFYPGKAPYRVLMKGYQQGGSIPIEFFLPHLEAALVQFNEQVAHNPFKDRIPVLLDKLSLCKLNNQYFLQDEKGQAIEVILPEPWVWTILSISGGLPFQAFLMLNESDAEIHALWFENQYYPLVYES